MRRRNRIFSAAGAVIGGSFLLPTGLASATPAIPLVCGQILTHSVTLQADLSCTGVALTLSGPVVVDLNRHTISGGIDDTLAAGGVYEIKNGTLDGNVSETGSFPTPVSMELRNLILHGTVSQIGTVTSSLSTISGAIGAPSNNAPLSVSIHNVMLGGGIAANGNVNVTGSTTGAISDYNSNVVVKNSSVIGVSANLSSVRVEDSAIASGGIAVVKPFGVTLVNDVIQGAMTGLSYVEGTLSGQGNGLSVSGTHFTADGTGMQISAPLGLQQTTITGNTFSANTAVGLSIDDHQAMPATGSTIADNRFVGNGGDGLDVFASTQAAGFHVSHNVATGNNGYGINAPGVVDGGANVASGNSQATQCVGVTCHP